MNNIDFICRILSFYNYYIIIVLKIQVKKDTCVLLPPRVPVRTPAHTGHGTEWNPAEDCGTAPPGPVSPVRRNQPARLTLGLVLCVSYRRCSLHRVRCLTSTSRRWDSCSALVSLREFPAFVTNTTGTLYFPSPSTRFLKHCLAAGMGVRPRTSTPSMSNRSPNKLRSCSHTSSKQTFVLVSSTYLWLEHNIGHK